jgi:hypothetical protein
MVPFFSRCFFIFIMNDELFKKQSVIIAAFNYFIKLVGWRQMRKSKIKKYKDR